MRSICSTAADRESYAAAYDPTEVDWEDALTEEQIKDIKARLGDVGMADSAVFVMAAMDEADILMMKETTRDAVASALADGIREDGLASAKDDIERKLSMIYTERDMAFLAYLPVDQYLAANMLYDDAATRLAQQAAAGTVKPVMYQKGQTIVVAGDVVTEAQLEMLRELGVCGWRSQCAALYRPLFCLLR